MHRIVIIGDGRAARHLVGHVRAVAPDCVFTFFSTRPSLRDRKWFPSQGVDLRTDVRPTGIDRFARTVTGSDGSRTGFHRLILAGSTSTGLARVSKLEVREGVLVNTHMQTSDGYIYAMGECAEPIRSELRTLDQQARTIAAHISRSSTAVMFGLDFALAL